MAKPSKTLEWATEPESEVLEPSLGKRLLGWGLERPAYQYFNWLFNLIGQWLGFIDTQFADDGVKRIQAAEGGFPASPGDGDVCLTGSTEVGLFVYRLSATDAPDGVMVYDGPGGVGRWLHSSYSARGIGDGVASLDGFGKVPGPQLGRGNNNGVASLNALGQVEQDPASRGLPGGVAALQPDGGMRATSTNPTFAGVVGIGDNGAAGVEGRSDTGVGGEFKANASRGAINIAHGSLPTGGEEGDLVVTGSALRVFAGGSWKTATLT